MPDQRRVMGTIEQENNIFLIDWLTLQFSKIGGIGKKVLKMF